MKWFAKFVILVRPDSVYRPPKWRWLGGYCQIFSIKFVLLLIVNQTFNIYNRTFPWMSPEIIQSFKKNFNIWFDSQIINQILI